MHEVIDNTGITGYQADTFLNGLMFYHEKSKRAEPKGGFHINV